MARTRFYQDLGVTPQLTPSAWNTTWASGIASPLVGELSLTRASSGNGPTSTSRTATSTSNADYYFARFVSKCIAVQKTIAYADGIQVCIYTYESSTSANAATTTSLRCIKPDGSERWYWNWKDHSSEWGTTTAATGDDSGVDTTPSESGGTDQGTFYPNDRMVIEWGVDVDSTTSYTETAYFGGRTTDLADTNNVTTAYATWVDIPGSWSSADFSNQKFIIEASTTGVGGSASGSGDITALKPAAGSDDGYKESTTWDNTYNYGVIGKLLTASDDFYCRFPGLNIPQGATIKGAHVHLEPYTAPSDVGVLVKIKAIAEDNTSTFSSDPSGRTLTAASNTWTIGSTSTWVESPDIKSVLQEVINRGGWASGNALGLVFKDNAGPSYTTFQPSAYESGTSLCPYLDASYTYGSWYLFASLITAGGAKALAGTAQGDGTLSVSDLIRTRGIAGTASGDGTLVVGKLDLTRPVVGTSQGDGTVSNVPLLRTRGIAGTAQGDGTATGALDVAGAVVDLAGTTQGDGSTSAAILRTRPFVGDASGDATLGPAPILRTRPLVGTAQGDGSASGVLDVAGGVVDLAGTTQGDGSVSNVPLLRTRPLAGQITGDGTTAAPLEAVRGLQGTSVGTGTASADLTVGGKVVDLGTATASGDGSAIASTFVREIGLEGGMTKQYNNLDVSRPHVWAPDVGGYIGVYLYAQGPVLESFGFSIDDAVGVEYSLWSCHQTTYDLIEMLWSGSVPASPIGDFRIADVGVEVTPGLYYVLIAHNDTVQLQLNGMSGTIGDEITYYAWDPETWGVSWSYEPAYKTLWADFPAGSATAGLSRTRKINGEAAGTGSVSDVPLQRTRPLVGVAQGDSTANYPWWFIMDKRLVGSASGTGSLEGQFEIKPRTQLAATAQGDGLTSAALGVKKPFQATAQGGGSTEGYLRKQFLVGAASALGEGIAEASLTLQSEIVCGGSARGKAKAKVGNGSASSEVGSGSARRLR